MASIPNQPANREASDREGATALAHARRSDTRVSDEAFNALAATIARGHVPAPAARNGHHLPDAQPTTHPDWCDRRGNNVFYVDCKATTDDDWTYHSGMVGTVTAQAEESAGRDVRVGLSLLISPKYPNPEPLVTVDSSADESMTLDQAEELAALILRAVETARNGATEHTCPIPWCVYHGSETEHFSDRITDLPATQQPTFDDGQGNRLANSFSACLFWNEENDDQPLIDIADELGGQHALFSAAEAPAVGAALIKLAAMANAS